MPRFLSQTLLRESSSVLSHAAAPSAPCSRLINHRTRSFRSEKAQLIELDLDSSDCDGDFLGLRRLEEAIHGVVARRLAPDWLPFIPGSSYWVPPRRIPLGIVEIVGKLKNPLTEEQSLSLTTVRGWPSSDFFVEGGSSHHQIKPKLKKKKTTESEDEES